MAKAQDETVSTSTELRTTVDVDAAIASLNDGTAGGYSSIKGNDFESRMAVAAALTSSEAIDNHKGETTRAPRVTLIDDDGKAFHATSTGLLGSVRTILSVLGEPHTWPKPVPVRIVEKRTNSGFKVFTIEFV
jgi:hypothetical protein